MISIQYPSDSVDKSGRRDISLGGNFFRRVVQGRTRKRLLYLPGMRIRNGGKVEGQRTEVAPNADEAVIALSASVSSYITPFLCPESAIGQELPVSGVLRPGSRAGASGHRQNERGDKGQQIGRALTGRS